MNRQFTSPERVIRIAFYDLFNPNWFAGENYQKNLFVALRSLEKSEQPRITLVTPHRRRRESSRYADQLLSYRETSRLQFFFTMVQNRLMGKSQEVRESRLSRVLRDKNVDCLFLKGLPGDNFQLPTLLWIADFQFLRMPEMFSAEEIDQRVKTATQVAKSGNAIIVSSRDSRSDFASFAPTTLHKAHVLSFVAHVPEDIYNIKTISICKKHQIPEKFFYLPNQFFKHKNHRVIIDTLKILKKKHPEIVVVCTGKGSDFRHKNYYEELKKEIVDFELEDQFIHLGVVPQEHVYQLMRQSIALLQPSLFEGWSTSVEEAKSLGKAVILSNIPVHREQKPPEGIYFDPYQPEQLAQILLEVYANKPPGPDLSLEALARRDLLPRMQEFGRTFMQIAKSAIS
ncbi:MAG: glycosyltransferase family 1 protein [Spirochaetota bacterium]